jgi:two-component sensor histidine kinase
MRYIFYAVFLLIIAFPLNAREVRVGIYQNPPKVYVDASGTPGGFIYEIINTISSDEKWDPVYVYDSWENNLRRLRENEIDIMIDVTYSPERALIYDFNSVPVIESWLQIFTMSGRSVENMSQLNGMNIAVLRGSVQHKYFETDIKKQFGIKYKLIDFPDYADTIEALRTGAANALVAGRFFYFSDLRDSDILPSPIILNPSNILFAFPKNRNHDLIAAVDCRLSTMKNDPESAYYKILESELSINKNLFIPSYIYNILGILITAAALFALTSIFLRRQVTKKTDEILKRNSELVLSKQNLEEAFLEKEHLIRELFHRTRNNMQVISSLLSMQSERASDSSAKAAFLDAVNRIHSISLVHDLLFNEDSLSRINLDRYIKELSFKVRESHGFNEESASIYFSLETVSLLFDLAVPCGLVINELLTNTFRHAFPWKQNGGRISISLAKTENSSIRIVYSNNGKPFIINETDQTPESIGMRLIKGIVQSQLKGTVEFTGGEAGFSCTIIFNETGYTERV